MLTPQEISERELVKAVFGGYDAAVVDDFLETIAADYGALYKENAILKSKIKVLVEKVEEYRAERREKKREKKETLVDFIFRRNRISEMSKAEFEEFKAFISSVE